MKVISLSPLLTDYVLWQDGSSAWTATVVCKATYDLLPVECRLAKKQREISLQEQFWNGEADGSLYYPCDLVPFKAAAEVLLVGHAHAPTDAPVRSLTPRLLVSDLDKCVKVIGDRAWDTLRDGGDRAISDGRFRLMPLRYERAAGGADSDNPVGRDRSPDLHGAVSIPNLVPHGTAIANRPHHIDPVGFGPISQSWPSRRRHLGRLAATWTGDEWISQPLPAELEAAYFNAAPQDQWVGELRADERIILEHLYPERRRLVTSLPGLHPRAFVERDGAARQLPLKCDTLWIDTDLKICTLTWRGQLGLSSASHDEARVFIAQQQRDAPITWGEVMRLYNELDDDDDDEPTGLTRIASRRAGLLHRDGALPFRPGNHPPQLSPTEIPDGIKKGDTGRLPAVSEQALPFLARSGVKPPPSHPNNADASGGYAAADASGGYAAADASGGYAAADASGAYAIANGGGGSPSASAQVTPPPPIPRPSTPSQLPPRPSPPSAPPPRAHSPSVPPPRPSAPSAPPPRASAPAAAPPRGSSPWAGNPLGSKPSPPPTPASVVSNGFTPAPELADPAPALAPPSRPLDPAARAATEPAPGNNGEPRADQRPTASTTATARPVLRLLWFDPPRAADLLEVAPWRRQITELELAPTLEPDDGEGGDLEEDEEDEDSALLAERRFFHVIACGEPHDASGLERALRAAVDEHGKMLPPLVLLAGSLELPFDEVEALKALLTAVKPLAGSDKKLKETVAAAEELFATPWLQGPGAVMERLTDRLREEYGRGRRALPLRDLEQHVQRNLLMQRSYQRRVVYGQQHLRCLFHFTAETPPLPAYLPEELAKQLPMLRQFNARLIGVVDFRQDQFEAHDLALRIVALARVCQLPAGADDEQTS